MGENVMFLLALTFAAVYKHEKKKQNIHKSFYTLPEPDFGLTFRFNKLQNTDEQITSKET